MLSNDGRKMWGSSLLLQCNISEHSKSIGSGRDKKFVSDAKCQCASYSITDSCQIYELAVCAKKPKSMWKLLTDTEYVKTSNLRTSFRIIDNTLTLSNIDELNYLIFYNSIIESHFR